MMIDGAGGGAGAGLGAGAGAGIGACADSGAFAQATGINSNMTSIIPIIILFIRHLPPMLLHYTITFKQRKG